MKDEGLEVSEETLKAIGNKSDKTPLSVQMRILRSQMEKMKPDDPKLPKIATQLMELEKRRERKRIEKRLEELDDDDYDMGMMW